MPHRPALARKAKLSAGTGGVVDRRRRQDAADGEHEFVAGQLVPGSRYRVVALVGQGGMGSVYEVEHVELGKRFVLKALLKDLASREDLVRRLRDEWRALGQLEHPNIVSVTDAGATLAGVPYYVMERLVGENLGQRLRRGKLPLQEAIRIAAEVLEALHSAHEIGVIHRDVKPPNVFLMQQGRAKLLDFGIAKLLDRATALTGKGVAIGTPRYMSPEQASGEGVDSRSDLYAVGLLLFEMISGQSPFEECAPDEIFLAHLMRTPPRVSEFVPDTPEEVSRLIARLLNKAPKERPANAGAAAASLRAMLRSYSATPPQDTLSDPPDGVLTPAFRSERPLPGYVPTTRRRSGEVAESKLAARKDLGAPKEGLTGDTVAERGPTAPSSTVPDGARRAVKSESARAETARTVPTEVLADPDSDGVPTRTSAPIGITPPPVSRSAAQPVPEEASRPRRRWSSVFRLAAAALVGAGLSVAGLFIVLRILATPPPNSAGPLNSDGDDSVVPTTAGQLASSGAQLKPLEERSLAPNVGNQRSGESADSSLRKSSPSSAPAASAAEPKRPASPPQAREKKLAATPPKPQAPLESAEMQPPRAPAATPKEPPQNSRRLPSSGL